MFALTDAAAVSSAVFYSSRVEAKTAQDFFENRLLALLGHADRRLGAAEYLAGDYGVADMALYPVFDARRALVEGKDRSEARRVGKACVSTCRSRWSPYP